MAAVDAQLIHRGDGLVKLFTPPFDRGTTDPGYIKGYLPGVRENGGQYTHAAIWALMAYAKQGDGNRAGELYALLNPINHALTRAGLHKYKVEPYVMAADIYALAPHVGRGGWTWYTGSASWMYRAALESILGFHLRGNVLQLVPCLPAHWPQVELIYRRGPTTYTIQVHNRNPAAGAPGPRLLVDGTPLASPDIALLDDGQTHTIFVQL
jgi:cyclic beta-1,2-glucan synthetase